MDSLMDYSNSTPPGSTAVGVNFTASHIFVTIVLTALIICTIVGNCLVILSVCLERKLRSPSNYLYVNLAVADMAVAILVMPIAVATEVTGQWLLTDAICDLWVFLDIMCCTASILNLCMISVDRYLVITRPLQYCRRRTCKFMAVIVGCVWTVATVITLPPVFGWGRNVHVDNSCLVSQDFGYTIYSTFGAFYGPLAVMLVLYYKIHKAATAAAAIEKRRFSVINNLNSAANVKVIKEAPEVVRFEDKNATSSGYNHKRRRSSIVGTIYRRRNSLMPRISSKRERKATQTLGIIMGTFIVCWLPFFIVALFRPYCDCNIPRSVESVFLWLGYLNSFLNPIIYPMFNRDFRKPYKRILSCQCSEMSYYKSMQEKRLSFSATTPRSTDGSKQYSDSNLNYRRCSSRNGSDASSSLTNDLLSHD